MGSVSSEIGSPFASATHSVLSGHDIIINTLKEKVWKTALYKIKV